MNTKHERAPRPGQSIARMLDEIEAHPLHGEEFRLLRKLPPLIPKIPEALQPGDRFIALVDTETSGLSLHTDKIIEIAILMLCVDAEGNVIGQLEPRSQLEDPGLPLPSNIIKLTEIADKELTGKRFDERTIVGLLARASVLVGHNAAYDAQRLEKRFPQLAGMRWACSCTELDWAAFGFEGRSQPFLLSQVGYFSTAHRAAADVTSLHALLQARYKDSGPTYLQRLLNAAERDSIRIEATGAPYVLKDALADRGYRWDADSKVWWIALEQDQAQREQHWLALNGVTQPTLHPQTAAERHRPPPPKVIKIRSWDEIYAIDDEEEPF